MEKLGSLSFGPETRLPLTGRESAMHTPARIQREQAWSLASLLGCLMSRRNDKDSCNHEEACAKPGVGSMVQLTVVLKIVKQTTG